MTICNDIPIERINVRLCRYLLGVHRKATNDAVRGELGRFPLLITILNNSFRYFKRMEHSCMYSLAKISCMDKDTRNLNFSWYNCMVRLDNVFNQSRSFLSDMQNVYRISWTNMIKNCTGKLRTYSQFKETFLLENYVTQLPLNTRRNLTKLRISAHNLAIETGRYNNTISSITSKPIDKRLCHHCKKVESEFHLIFECQLYDNVRKKLIERINEVSIISFQANSTTFCTLMSCLNGDYEVSSIVCDFLNECFGIRRDSNNQAKENNILLRPETTKTRCGRISKRPTRIDL